MQKIIGSISMILIVFGGFVALGGTPMQIIKPVDIFIIFGAGFAAMVISTEWSTIKLGTKQIKLAFTKGIHNKEYYDELLSLLFELINIAKTQDRKALDKHVEAPEESVVFSRYPTIYNDEVTKNFIIDSFRCIIASKAQENNAHHVEADLDEELAELKKQYIKPSTKFAGYADSLPGLGILCAIMALVLVMGKLDADIYTIGTSIAGALVGTLTGVLGCYCIVSPLAGAAGEVATKQIEPLVCVRTAVLQYVRGSSAHISVNAARKHIQLKWKPSFTELEERIATLRDIQNQGV
ncbi:motility-associated protein [Vibrio barjaei]|uniref:motility-associated protein n=1 Tax=Vibrio barjaei TaxID=1676683 RepID=UPI0022841B54|nr:motility-associated protein [Vibrio barjaei]MCY9872294.1 MotA/TolQ/ExbB proton channel family protein [Vibrio barjaei]